ncbi:hypothetical protein HYV85_02075 [Candidatus Woesearchaeota archaeon]|nr:hypothetical protein [Candidatus Woesearchaeota archaeon]
MATLITKLNRVIAPISIAAGLYVGIAVGGANFAKALNYERNINSAAQQMPASAKGGIEVLVGAPQGSGDEKPQFDMGVSQGGIVKVSIESIPEGTKIYTPPQRSDYVRNGLIDTGAALFAIAFGGWLLYDAYRNRSTSSEE